MSAPLLLLSLLAGCRGGPGGGEAEEVELTLAEASEQVTFGSIEMLGSHSLTSTATRTEERAGRASSQHEEVVEIRWQDWDNFSFRRVVDGKGATETVVHQGRAYVNRLGGGWEPKEDAENYRVQLRTTWNAWDQTLSPFGDRVVMTEAGGETIAGRPARKYTLSLAPLPEGAPTPPGKRLQPASLSGAVWVDEGTAVRLQADVEGVLQQGDLRRTVKLRLAHDQIGQPQAVQAPAGLDGVKPSPNLPENPR